jgi:hypothetical protein
MTATVSIAQSDLQTILRSFILSLIDCEVVAGLDNGVPMPVNPFVAVTPLYFNRLATNEPTYTDPGIGQGTSGVKQSISYTWQIDCYGPQSSDWAAILTTMFRDSYGVDFMAPIAAPLYADDPKQMPVVDGEENFEQRWLITAVLQYNPVVTIPVQYFNVINITSIDVDTSLFNELDTALYLDSNSTLG